MIGEEISFSFKVFLKREGMMGTSKPKGHTQQDWNIKIK